MMYVFEDISTGDDCPIYFGHPHICTRSDGCCHRGKISLRERYCVWAKMKREEAP